MKTLNYLPWITCCFISIGCKVNYEITMKPVDGGLERKTEVTGSLKQFEKDSLTNVFGTYREERAEGAQQIWFSAPKTASIWEGVVNAEWDDGIGGLVADARIVKAAGHISVFASPVIALFIARRKRLPPDIDDHVEIKFLDAVDVLRCIYGANIGFNAEAF